MQTLFAKLINVEQYNAADKTILYEDPLHTRWPKVYGRLTAGDIGFFVGQGVIYIGVFANSEEGKSVRFMDVQAIPISVDQLLCVDELQPEAHAQMKAKFVPFLDDTKLDYERIIETGITRDFIRFFILPEKQFVASAYKNGDRIVLVDEDLVFTRFGRVQDRDLSNLENDSWMFPIQGKTVYDAVEMLKSAKDGREGNNVKQLNRIIQKLNKGESYQFPSFSVYYNLIHNRSAYAIGTSSRQYYAGGYTWEDGPQLERFLEDGVWVNGYDGKFIDEVKAVPVGSRLALKTTAKKNDELIIKGVGTVTGNEGDGNRLIVEWDEDFQEFRLPFSGGYWDTIKRVTNPEYIQKIFFSKQTFKMTTNIQRSPLNTILYGPPGTGKTYHTIFMAVQIVTGEDFANRYDEAKEAYKAARESGHIEFITFHQNYSYEDFVAGLRPDTDVGTLTFKEHKGIFYNICDRARANLLGSKKEPHFTEADFDTVWDELLQPLRNSPAAEIELETSRDRKPFWLTRENEYNLSFRKSSGGTGHTLSFKTIQQIFEGKRDYPLTGIGIYLHPVVARLRELAVARPIETETEPLQNYVLIIDEINRANISRVFGELITLLEEDKRWGNEHEMEVKLPNGERFSVPANLYIIGTMNTADKSIALIDIALRRRFQFEPMYPTREVVDDIPTVQYREFLYGLNDEILKLKGPDFLIGHAYFITNQEDETLDFGTLANRKIIPLLNEYFYNEPDDKIVFNLLNSRAGIPAGYCFVEDAYLGVQCKNVSNDN